MERKVSGLLAEVPEGRRHLFVCVPYATNSKILPAVPITEPNPRKDNRNSEQIEQTFDKCRLE